MHFLLYTPFREEGPDGLAGNEGVDGEGGV